MTERTGGSDVGLTETVARPDGDGSGAFAVRHEVVHARRRRRRWRSRSRGPRATPPGGRGLALFYVEVARRRRPAERHPGQPPQGQARHAQGADRGAHARRRAGDRRSPARRDGIRNITPMLNVTRTWNAVCAVAGMRRGLALARDYARRRVAFGAPLVDKPLHADTLARLEAEYEGAFCLAFRVVELLGREEAGEHRRASERAPPPAHADREAHDRQAGGRGRERGARGVRRRRLHRGHRPAAAPPRRAGAADLGGHDQRALARRARALAKGGPLDALARRDRRAANGATDLAPRSPRRRAAPSRTRRRGSPRPTSKTRSPSKPARAASRSRSAALSSSRSSFARAPGAIAAPRLPRGGSPPTASTSSATATPTQSSSRSKPLSEARLDAGAEAEEVGAQEGAQRDGAFARIALDEGRVVVANVLGPDDRPRGSARHPTSG